MLYLYSYIDLEAPRICCPYTLSIDSAVTAALTWNEPRASDNSGQVPTVTYSLESGGQFVIGATKVVCDARDLSGNQRTCAFTIRIKGEAN